MAALTLTFKPVTRSEWPDLEALFAESGVTNGCWCMWWRIKRADFDRQYGTGNKAAFKAIVDSGEVPGLLAYEDGRPVGWCSVAPREVFPVLDRSPVLKRVDDRPVWSIVCFFIAGSHRSRGVMEALIGAAVAYAKDNGATLIEGYPAIPEASSSPETAIFTGVYEPFARAGFTDVARRSKIRAIMRYEMK
jgi:GNAT superfamily N-acetyltransferase